MTITLYFKTKLFFEQATKVNCPGATADGENVLAFNDVTGSCDWAVNVPGCGGQRCYNVKCKNIMIKILKGDIVAFTRSCD